MIITCGYLPAEEQCYRRGNCDESCPFVEAAQEDPTQEEPLPGCCRYCGEAVEYCQCGE